MSTSGTVRKAIVFVGAGLSKALEKDGFPVPLMWDFVPVAATYAKSDPTLLTTLTQLEISGVFKYSTPESRALADKIAPPNQSTDDERAEFLEMFSSREAENIEHLLIRAHEMAAHPPQGTTFAQQLNIELLPLRFSFAINRLFYLIGWNIAERTLRTFVRRLQRTYAATTFISFNYDLILEHIIEDATEGNWPAANAYGMPFFEFVDIEEANQHIAHSSSTAIGGAVGMLASHQTTQAQTSTIKVLKPHGSLDWLCPFTGNYKFAGLPTHLALSSDERVGYLSGFNVELLQRPGVSPWPNVGVFIFPPTEKIPIPHLLDQEKDALLDADDVYMIGWRASSTDTDQIDLIRDAVSRRPRDFRRVTVIDRSKSRQYYRRLRRVLSPADSFEVWPFGFQTHERCFLRRVVAKALAWLV